MPTPAPARLQRSSGLRQLRVTSSYRSFLNRQDPADDFNRIRFGEGELFLWVAPDGVIQGTLGCPADPLANEKDFMDVTGRVTSWLPPAVELEGLGRPETGTEAFDYKYQAILAPSFPDADDQRPALVGTVMRAKPHDSAPASFTASLAWSQSSAISCARRTSPESR